MLRETIDVLFTKYAPGARALGLAYEAAAIAARYRRVGRNWEPHLTASRATILQGAEHCRKFDRALVIGAGGCFDIPVKELAERFSEVILADVAVSAEARRWERRSRGRVRAVAWDATGALATLARRQRAVTAAEAVSLFADSEPGNPPCEEADLVVSANCVSQFGLIPADRLAAAESEDELATRCTHAAAARHLIWLAARPGIRVLISDIARLDMAPDGSELARRTIFDKLTLRPPDRTWRWAISPIPELSREWHRVHDVGAWIDGSP